MRRFIKEWIILLIQLLMFYIFPMTAGPTDAMGMVFLIIVSTFTLSVIIGSISDEKIKYVYSIVIAILFIPSVFIYYNESALIHAIWYLVIGTVGVGIGAVVHKIIFKTW